MSALPREPANGLTHLTGVILALVALAVLIGVGIHTGNALALVALIIFGLSQVALYTASTLHHSLRLSARASARLLRLDCMMVFVFIAGTYTPVCLIALHHFWRWGLLAAVWGLVLSGLLCTTRWMRAPAWLSTAFYVLIGWIGLIAAPALFHAIPRTGAIWMLVGGAIYTVGALIFVLERPNLVPGKFDAHALWHVFVMGGSFCCFWLIVRYVAPLG